MYACIYVNTLRTFCKKKIHMNITGECYVQRDLVAIRVLHQGS